MPGDSVFVKGSTHLVCEDYAQHGDGFALVSDGCSSAPRSDVAARLVYLGARRAFAEARLRPEIDAAALKELDLRHLALAAHDEPLFATLLTARVLGSRAVVTVVGDGEVLTARQGTVERRKFHYPLCNAPYYPAYALQPPLEALWRRDFPDNPLVIEREGAEPERSMAAEPWVTLEWNVEDLEWILLTSDGLSSFVDAHGRPVEERRVIDGLCAFKNRTGGFLQRRVLRLLDELRAEGIAPYDDFSAAVLTFD